MRRRLYIFVISLLLWQSLWNVSKANTCDNRQDEHDFSPRKRRRLRVEESINDGTRRDKLHRHLADVLRPWLRVLQDRSNDENEQVEDSLVIPQCGEVLAILPTQDLRDLLEQMLVTNLQDLTEEEMFVIRVAILPEVDYGIQVIKICGKCSDYAGLYEGVCEAHHYATGILHSGLALLPLQRDSTRLVRGTRPVTILHHGTQPSNLLVPSNLWNATATDPDGLVLFGTLFTSMTATISLLPDFTGYGESRDTAYRAYIVQQAYATATLPLYWELQSYLQNVSDCKTAAAESLAIVGYSEGGYAAVALAHVLQEYLPHYDIIQVRAGGAPLKISTQQLKFLVSQVLNGTFDYKRRYYVALLAATFSTTTTDVDNFNTNQDLVDAAQRTTILQAIHNNSDGGRGSINTVIPIDNPLSILDADKIGTFQRAVLAGEADPCLTSVVPGETDLLCQALKAQDLYNVVLQAPYPVVLCHSPNDTLVAFSNIPTRAEASTNPNIDLEFVNGDHAPAALECFLQSLLWFVKNMEAYKVPVELHNKDGCDAASDNDEGTLSTASFADKRAGGLVPTLVSVGMVASCCMMFMIL